MNLIDLQDVDCRLRTAHNFLSDIKHKADSGRALLLATEIATAMAAVKDALRECESLQAIKAEEQFRIFHAGEVRRQLNGKGFAV